MGYNRYIQSTSDNSFTLIEYFAMTWSKHFPFSLMYTLYTSNANREKNICVTLDVRRILPYAIVLVCCFNLQRHDDVIKWKHLPRFWSFVRGIHRSPVNSPHKGQWRGALMFSLICVWINDKVNSRKAGDLRRYRAHYDVIVTGNGVFYCFFLTLNN